MHRQTASRRGRTVSGTFAFTLPCAASLLFALTAPLPTHAQESLRLSLAGADAARARRDASSALDRSNLKLGPTLWNFAGSLGLQFDDNIRLEPTHPRADLIAQPELDTRMLWRVSDVNNLSLGLGAGYSAYATHPEFDRFFVAPGSELSFDLYAGDFWFNFHDRFSITENTYQDPTVVGSGDYAQLVNAAGLSTTWDLNKVVLKVGYDHVNYLWLQDDQSPGRQPSGIAEVFSASAGYTFRPGLSAGLEAGGSLFHYTSVGQLYTDATQWNIGAFSELQLSSYLHGRLSAGYTLYTPDVPAFFGDALQFSGIYAQADLAHRVNRILSYTLTAARTINFAFYGGTIDLYLVRWQADWKLLRHIVLSTIFEYQHGTQLALFPETFDRFGPGMSVGHVFNAKFAATLAYQYYQRCSDLPGRQYAANIISVNLTYKL